MLQSVEKNLPASLWDDLQRKGNLYFTNLVIMQAMKLCTWLLHIFLRQVSQHFTIAFSNTAIMLYVEELMQDSPKRGFKNTLESLRQLLCALGQYLQHFVILASLSKSSFLLCVCNLCLDMWKGQPAEYDLLASACPSLPLLTCHS